VRVPQRAAPTGAAARLQPQGPIGDGRTIRKVAFHGVAALYRAPRG
jgi:hypothetical protein